MAEGCDPLTKLVTCSVCLGVLTQPKLLACTHAFCTDCIDHLPVDLVDGDHTIYCPTCREPTKLPDNGSAASLRPAFVINTLIALRYTAVKLPVAVADKSIENKCLKHDRPLEMYCDDCQQVFCSKCVHYDHRDHNCNYISDVFDKHQQEIIDHLQPLKQQQSLVFDALNDLNTQQKHVATCKESVENQIDAFIDQLVQAIHQSGAELKQNVNTSVQPMLDNISQKKEEGEVFLTLLKSCEQHIQDKLHNGSQQEILLKKNEMMATLKATSQKVMLQQLQLKEEVDIKFQHSSGILEKCRKIGEVSIDGVAAATAHTNGDQSCVKLTSSAVGRLSNIDITVPNVSWLKRNSLACCLVADVGGVSMKCEIKHVKKEKYHVSFTATHEGLYHIKVKSKETNIPCNPCTIQVVPSIQVEFSPLAIATTTNGLLVVAGDACIAVMDKEGHVVSKYDSQSGGNKGICITPDNYILVVRNKPPHIIKYTMDCALANIANTGNGNGPLQFNCSHNIHVSVGTSGHVYVCDTDNHRIQVLNPDLTFSHMFGEEGSGPGQFTHPRGIAIDSQDMVYVCDYSTYRIQKLSSNGAYISGFKLPSRPRYIAIDYNTLYITVRNTVAAYSTDGAVINKGFLLPDEKWSYKGVAVDDEHVYVCDYDNKKIILVV